jgi:hypothetical protein
VPGAGRRRGGAPWRNQGINIDRIMQGLRAHRIQFEEQR